MNRNDLIGLVAQKTERTKKEIKEIIDIYEDTIKETLLGGEDVNLYEFVNFKIKTHKEKQYTNPRTGEKSVIPQKKVIKAEISKILNRDY